MAIENMDTGGSAMRQWRQCPGPLVAYFFGGFGHEPANVLRPDALWPPADPIPADPLAPAGILTDDLDTYDLDFQDHFHLGDRNNIVWGLGYRFTHEEDDNAPALAFLPPVLGPKSLQRICAGRNQAPGKLVVHDGNQTGA